MSQIVVSVGKREQFDMNVMPLSKASPEKWKRIDRAFRLGQELPPVSLLERGGAYFVNAGNYRVSACQRRNSDHNSSPLVGFPQPRAGALADRADELRRSPISTYCVNKGSKLGIPPRHK